MSDIVIVKDDTYTVVVAVNQPEQVQIVTEDDQVVVIPGSQVDVTDL